jgi:hypothetical protein
MSIHYMVEWTMSLQLSHMKTSACKTKVEQTLIFFTVRISNRVSQAALLGS